MNREYEGYDSMPENEAALEAQEVPINMKEEVPVSEPAEGQKMKASRVVPMMNIVPDDPDLMRKHQRPRRLSLKAASFTNLGLLDKSSRSKTHAHLKNYHVKHLLRRRTFVNTQDFCKDTLQRGESTIHNPMVESLLLGLAIQLSYLIDEPPEHCVTKQNWDIFTVPGDTTKVKPPASESEKKDNAGQVLIPVADVYKFMTKLFKLCQWSPECHVIAFILLLRVVRGSKGSVHLHRYNWECLIIVSLLVTQKFWDDVSLNNVDFPRVWKMVSPNGGDLQLMDVNFMEKEFLCLLRYNLQVK